MQAAGTAYGTVHVWTAVRGEPSAVHDGTGWRVASVSHHARVRTTTTTATTLTVLVEVGANVSMMVISSDS